ncbi:MAG TPA: hypothetical protein VKZ85_11415 [Woeseiaceae bacterium]|nr:hypothetical protein [Woeseiaceae bacterium]
MVSGFEQQARPGALRAVLYAGLLAGALDLAYALVANGMRGIEPARIMQSIASGLLGTRAYEHGAATATLGVVLHFLIMFVIAATWYAASRRIALLTERPIVTGLAYGVVVYVVMNFVVLPLSAFPHQLAFTPASVAVGGAAMLFCVGVPIALVVKRFG